MFGEKVQHFCEKHHLITKGDTILVAVSGGPDSMALLHYLKSIKDRLDLKLVALSVDHMLRGEQSKEDVSYVRSKCKEWDIKFIETSVNVNTYKKEHQLGTQIAARKLRYQFFMEQMKTIQANSLAMGHHGDDQIETVFMHLMRSASSKGLTGIPYKRPFGPGFIIRPLLPVTKAEIEEYCRENGIEPRRDPSNNEAVYTRNAFRLHMLPFLKEHNPIIHKHVQLLSEHIDEDENFLMKAAEKALKPIIQQQEKPKSVILKINGFKQLAQPLQRRSFHLILNYLYKEKLVDLSFVHYETFLDLINSNSPNRKLNFPMGLTIIRAYDTITFTFETQELTQFKYLLNPGDEVTLLDGSVISATIHKEHKPNEQSSDELVCEVGNVVLPLIVRNRQSGDRIKIRGLDGTKKVKDIFINEKIPKLKRDQWPVVTDANGKLLWLVGLKKGVQEGINNKEWLKLTYNKNPHL